MKLDKKVFAIKTFAQAEHNRTYWLTKTLKERIAAAWIFSCRMYHLNPKNPEEIKLDREYSKIRSRS